MNSRWYIIHVPVEEGKGRTSRSEDAVSADQRRQPSATLAAVPPLMIIVRSHLFLSANLSCLVDSSKHLIQTKTLENRTMHCQFVPPHLLPEELASLRLPQMPTVNRKSPANGLVLDRSSVFQFQHGNLNAYHQPRFCYATNQSIRCEQFTKAILVF